MLDYQLAPSPTHEKQKKIVLQLQGRYLAKWTNLHLGLVLLKDLNRVKMCGSALLLRALDLESYSEVTLESQYGLTDR